MGSSLEAIRPRQENKSGNDLDCESDFDSKCLKWEIVAAQMRAVHPAEVIDFRQQAQGQFLQLNRP